MNHRNAELARLFSPAELVQAREWIAECCWGDLDAEDVNQLSAEQVANGIRRNYDGGILQFKADCIPVQLTPNNAQIFLGAPVNSNSNRAA